MATNKPTRTAKNQPEPAGEPTEGLKVVARSNRGLRRAGRFWGPEPEVVSLAKLTPEQLEALEEEPGLVTVRVPFEEPTASAEAAA